MFKDYTKSKFRKPSIEQVREVILPWSTEVDVRDYVNHDGSYRAILLDAHRVKTPLDVVRVHDETTIHEGKDGEEGFACRCISIDYTDKLGNRQEVQVKLFT